MGSRGEGYKGGIVIKEWKGSRHTIRNTIQMKMRPKLKKVRLISSDSTIDLAVGSMADNIGPGSGRGIFIKRGFM